MPNHGRLLTRKVALHFLLTVSAERLVMGRRPVSAQLTGLRLSLEVVVGGRAQIPAPTGVLASFRYVFSSPARLRMEVFGGLAVALALIPEVLSFSILAGLDPRVGLFASVIMAISISL